MNTMKAFNAALLITSLGLSFNLAQAEVGAESNYPVGILNIVKDFTKPVQDSTECSGGGLIPEINCHLNKFDVNGVGVFNGQEDSGHYFTIRVTTDSVKGYDYYVEAWVDYRNQDGTLNDKFMNYWFADNGDRGLIEILPGYPGRSIDDPQYSEEAIKVTWDSRTLNAQTMSIQYNRIKDGQEVSWENRAMAAKFDVIVDSINDTAELVGSVNWNADEEDPEGFAFNMKRDSERTLVLGKRYDVLGETILENRASECVQNNDRVILEEAAQLNDLEGGACDSLISTLTLTPEAPTQSRLYLIGDESDELFSLDTTDQF